MYVPPLGNANWHLGWHQARHGMLTHLARIARSAVADRSLLERSYKSRHSYLSQPDLASEASISLHIRQDETR